MAIVPVTLPTVRVAAGTRFYRVHGALHGARFYGRRDGGWRFDDPAFAYGVFYAGQDPVAAFAETLLRWPSSRRDLLWSDVEARRMAHFELSRDVVLAKLHGSGVAAFGLAPGELTGEDYAECQAASSIAHGDGGCDGLRYRSRFENDVYCIALFDRADDALTLIQEGLSIERDWTHDMLKERGYRLIDL